MISISSVFLMLLPAAVVSQVTCDALKGVYQTNGCCADSTASVPACDTATFSAVGANSFVWNKQPYGPGQTLAKPTGPYAVDHIQLGESEVAHTIMSPVKDMTTSKYVGRNEAVSVNEDMQMHVFVPSKRTDTTSTFPVWDNVGATGDVKGFGTWTNSIFDMALNGYFFSMAGLGLQDAPDQIAWGAKVAAYRAGTLSVTDFMNDPVFQTAASTQAYFKTYWSTYDASTKTMQTPYTLADMADGTFPIIVTMDGDPGSVGESALRYHNLAELASHGYIVLAFQGIPGGMYNYGRPMGLTTNFGTDPNAYPTGPWTRNRNTYNTPYPNSTASEQWMTRNAWNNYGVDDEVLTSYGPSFVKMRALLENFFGTRADYKRVAWAAMSAGMNPGAMLSDMLALAGIDSDGDAIAPGTTDKILKIGAMISIEGVLGAGWTRYGNPTNLRGLQCPILSIQHAAGTGGAPQANSRDYWVTLQRHAQIRLDKSPPAVREQSGIFWAPFNAHYDMGMFDDDESYWDTQPRLAIGQSLVDQYPSQRVLSGKGGMPYPDGMSQIEWDSVLRESFTEMIKLFADRNVGNRLGAMLPEISLLATSMGGSMDWGGYARRTLDPVYPSIVIGNMKLQGTENTLHLSKYAPDQFYSDPAASVDVAAPLSVTKLVVGTTELTETQLTALLNMIG
tara:strand:+ start:3572 stop:5599 length:2028 start_codon:yes stop_codon:yes gene_type:complete